MDELNVFYRHSLHLKNRKFVSTFKSTNVGLFRTINLLAYVTFKNAMIKTNKKLSLINLFEP